MFDCIIGLVFVVVAIGLWVLERSYRHVPAHELKRLARSGDDVAQLLYQAAAYGTSLRVLLRGGAIVLAALSLIALIQAFGSLLGVIVVLVLVGLGGFIFVPGNELTRTSLALAKWAAPAIAWLLERLQPVLDAGVRFARRYRHVYVHTGLYEKTDLAELLERQRGQEDSRISVSEIDLLRHNLSFGDKLVVDALVPKRVVKTVAASDAIGPVLMDELSKSGHSRFPVYDGKHDNIVGILYLHDLVGAKHSGTVADIMKTKLTYVHENFTLYQTLQAFLKTKHHLFLVVNSFEELVGIITIEDVLEQMVGKPIVDEFDHYDDLRAVAAADAKKDHKNHDEPKAEPKTEQPPTVEPSEVIQ